VVAAKPLPATAHSPFLLASPQLKLLWWAGVVVGVMVWAAVVEAQQFLF
jgi:hypothetical protein